MYVWALRLGGELVQVGGGDTESPLEVMVSHRPVVGPPLPGAERLLFCGTGSRVPSIPQLDHCLSHCRMVGRCISVEIATHDWFSLPGPSSCCWSRESLRVDGGGAPDCRPRLAFPVRRIGKAAAIPGILVGIDWTANLSKILHHSAAAHF